MMKKIFLFLLLFVFFGRTVYSQTTPSYYYYSGNQIPINFSDRVLTVKFNSGQDFSLFTRQLIITNSHGDLINGNLDSIPDIVQIRSRITTTRTLVYPCGIDTASRTNSSPSVKPDANKPPLCEGCPPPVDCTPYWVTTTTNNFDSILTYLQSIPYYVMSASKAIIKNTDTAGTINDFYIKLKPPYTISDLSSLLSSTSSAATDESLAFGTDIYRISTNLAGSQFCIGIANQFFESGKVDFAAPDFYQHVKITESSDPFWTDQWALSNTGQYSGIAGADIRLLSAGTISKGSGIKVGVVDDGVILNEPDLVDNLLPNIDTRVLGTNFGPGIHGTGMAGIIAAVENNNIDITGVAPLSKVIPVHAFTSEDDASNIVIYSGMAKGIALAVKAGADVVNCSWRLDFENDLINLVISDAQSAGRGGKGTIVVFAAGNKNNPMIDYPARLPNVIAVGAMTMCNQRKTPTACDPNQLNWGSNYGDNLSMVAPGVRIRTVTCSAYSFTIMYTNGSSPATAHISGVAALMLAVNPNLTYSEVRRILEFSSNKVGNYCYTWAPNHPNGGWNTEMGYGRINAYNAVQLSRPGVTISQPVYNVAGQNATQVSNNISIIFNQAACATTLPGGVNFLRRFEVSTNITFPYAANPVIICSSNGFNLANPNDGRRFAEAINVTNTSATLRTYIYQGYNSIGQLLGYIPATPSNIKFTYSVVSSPTALSYELQKGTIPVVADSIQKIPFKIEQDGPGIQNDLKVNILTAGIIENPVKDEVKLNVTSEVRQMVDVSLFNNLGMNILKTKKQIVAGSNVISLDIHQFPAGIYYIKYNNETYKFIKN